MFVLPDEYESPELLAQLRGNIFMDYFAGRCQLDSWGNDLARLGKYKLHGQMHIGDMLDQLSENGVLTWRWEHKNSTAAYWVRLSGQKEKRFETRAAEELVQRLANEQRIVWIPVPLHRGEDKWEMTLARMEQMKEGQIPKPWES